ncbi:oxidoreductase [Paractinoplanes abujensis]|uniref:NADPH:quinone reductase-like Zn-dependent oxidoreductase n=1 Tax=Paractinoplanes abujensis TaxID=882441 RepID=A0A7W7CU50_9ACTN|nr:zinc-binding dehydrogenase [Actinoplanes abujensis]MBB4693021.1 NADPH:quinone reductase-like Zn-dependent oxidoreductase [Actinoplanes abujensis]GID22476.1 oxidoreductase [Actinoplanes abujensis]
MRALLVDHTSSSGLTLGVAPQPAPGPGEALVKVEAFALNAGDLATASGLTSGSVPGWEAAGHVVAAAADGSGPAAGTPVTTFGHGGGWAEYRAVSTAMLGAAPPGADLAAISTVPVAAGSALRALRRAGPTLGRRIMVTGATGGVGRYAIQLARIGGARPVAVTRSARRFADELRDLGAEAVVADPADYDDTVHTVIDTVGGELLVRAFDRLENCGVLVSLGHLATGGETFPYAALMADPQRNNRSIVSFHQFDGSPLPPDFAWLNDQLTRGALRPSISWRGSWTRAGEAIEALRTGTLHGKAVVEVG